MTKLPTSVSDTDTWAQELMARRLKEMSPGEKLVRTAAFMKFSRRMVAANIERRYPNLPPRELRFRFAVETLGEELATRYFS